MKIVQSMNVNFHTSAFTQAALNPRPLICNHISMKLIRNEIPFLYDAVTNEPVYSWVSNRIEIQHIHLKKITIILIHEIW